MGFPHSSVGKESTCNAGDPSSIPGVGRSAGEGIGFPLQYSWASLVAQLVKNLPAVWETWVQSLGQEDPLDKEMVTHSSILAWRGFPDSSVGKESTCNAGDPSSIPGLERSPGEAIVHPLQYSWASLLAQTVKRLPTMQETQVLSLGQEDPLEKAMATHSSTLAWKIP